MASKQPKLRKPKYKRTRKCCYWIDCETVEAVNTEGGPPVTGAVIEGMLGGGRTERVIDEDDHHHVRVVSFGGRRWVQERVPSPGLRARLMRRVPAWKRWHAGRDLRAAGLPIWAPLMLVHQVRTGGHLFVLPYREGEPLDRMLKQLKRDPDRPKADRSRRRAAEAFGAVLGAITAAGYLNEDLRVQQFLVESAGDGDPADNAGVRMLIADATGFEQDDGVKPLARMLASAWASAEQFGPVRATELARCLRAMRQAHPDLAGGKKKRLLKLLRLIQKQKQRTDKDKAD